MNRSLPGLLGLSILTLFSPALLNAQLGGMGGHRPAYAIHVQVRFANGQPGPRGIHVRLESAEGGAEADCETTEEGKCEFKPAYAGAYTVRMSEPKYQPASARVDLVGTTTGFVSFELKPLPGEQPGEAPADASGPAPAAVSVADLNIPENARKEYEKGEAALREKKLEDSAKHLQKAVKIYDSYTQAYLMLGETYLEQQDWKRSEEALKKSISLEPKLTAAYVSLGAVYNQRKDYTQAEVALKKGLELSPDATTAKYELAKTYWATNRWQEAAPYAQAVVKETPALAGAHVLYANILLRQRDAPGALREYQEYLRLEPGGPMATQVRAQVEKLEKALTR